MQARRHGQQRLAGAGRPVTGDERDGRVQQGIQEALLAEVGRAQVDPARDVQRLGHLQPLEPPLGKEPRGHGLAFASPQQHVFVEHHAGEPGVVDFQFPGAGEALEFVRMDLDAAQVVALHVPRLDLVVEVILAPQPHCQCLEVHVQVFGHQDGRNLLGLLDQQHGCQDAVVHPLGVRKDAGGSD